jgi:hypothetical protein
MPSKRESLRGQAKNAGKHVGRPTRLSHPADQKDVNVDAVEPEQGGASDLHDPDRHPSTITASELMERILSPSAQPARI